MAASFPIALAVFGTLSNGANAQLLGAPEGQALAPGVVALLRRLFDSVRPRLAALQGEELAFLPAGEGPGMPWLLLRLDPPQRGAIGEVGRIWAAILPPERLEAIGWGVHLLFDGAFPPPHQPETGAALALRDCAPGPPPDLPELVLRAADAAALIEAPIALEPAPGQSGKDAIAALWSRTPPSHRRRSFATHPLLGGTAEVVVGATDGRHRVDLGAGAPVLPLAEEIARTLLGIAFPPRPPLPAEAQEAEIAAAAETLAKRIADSAAGGGQLERLARLHARSHDALYRAAYAAALPRLARRMAAAGLAGSDLCAALAAALAISPGLGAEASLAQAFADLVLDRGLAPDLSDGLLDWLAPALGSPERAARLGAAMERLGPAPAVPFADWWRRFERVEGLERRPDLLARLAVEADGGAEADAALERLERLGGFWPGPLIARGYGGRVELRARVERRWLALPAGDPRRRGGLARLRRARRVRGSG